MELTLRSLLVGGIARFGDRAALLGPDGRTLNYRQLERSADRLAHLLVAAGVSPGDPVALLMGNRVEWVVADQAILRAGGAKVPINPMLSAAEMAYILADSGATVALADDTLAAVARDAGVAQVIELGEAWERALATETDGPPDVKVAPADIALILYTGGTTGRQKGVLHTQEALAVNLLAHDIEIGILDDERIPLTAPLAHSAGFLLNAGLLKGAFHVLATRFDASTVIDTVIEHAITVLFLVPTMIYRLLDADHREGEIVSLRTILYGAAPITLERLEQGIERFGPVFMQLYGQSEAPNFLTRLTREDHDPAHPDRLSSCGRAAALVSVAVLDDDDRPVPTGQVGEICARAPYVMTGYRGMPEKTAETLRGGWLHTGDIGTIDADGFVHLLDRKNDMVITGGFNVYTTEVEQVIAGVAGVRQTAVVGIPHPDWGEAVVAYVVAEEGFDDDSVRVACDDALGRYKQPKAVVRVDVLPTTAVGKVDKVALRQAWPGWTERMR
ncbi:MULTISPECIES: AMP-binding protein [unclassified Microbacterium]|uniref:AMP-binding protein n=1 Tax=unclassified Microbacterium TaxID=2609290 RepID=UPI000C2B97DD|nr:MULTISPECIES: AMP-binding protein [unclassified Microbacterium]